MSTTAAVPASPAHATGPVSAKERIRDVDILRGWALLGILVVNLANDQPWFKEYPGVLNRPAFHAIEFLADSKFYTLFSFLFGLGFFLQMDRLESRGTRFVPIYCRRLLALLVIGVLSSLVAPVGQLIVYATLGFLLLLFRRLPLNLVLAVAAGCLVFFPLRDGLIARQHEARLRDPATAQQTTREDAQKQAEKRARREEDIRTHSEGTLREIVALRGKVLLEGHSSFPWIIHWDWLGAEFPLLLLGLYAGRRRIFEDIPAHLGLIHNVRLWGLIVGLVATTASYPLLLIETPPWVTNTVGRLLWSVGAPALCFFYAGSVVLLARRPGWTARLAPVAALGSLGLSNYLFQAAAEVVAFDSVGFGLFGHIGSAAALVIAAIVYPCQIGLSAWWVRHFRLGPAEWVWRSLTYSALQPMRHSSTAAA
jgi:uncharacterized protein